MNSPGKKLMVLIFIMAVIAGAFYLTKNYTIKNQNLRKPELSSTEGKLKRIKVEARKGKFFPDEFDIGLGDSIILEIKAFDRDYTFDLPELGIREKLAKGKTSEVKIDGLGIGKYKYSCGEICSGIVEVESKSDEED